MEEFIQINENKILSDEVFCLTKRGMKKIDELQINDIIIGFGGECTIINIVIANRE